MEGPTTPTLKLFIDASVQANEGRYGCGAYRLAVAEVILTDSSIAIPKWLLEV